MDVNSLPKTITRQRRGCDLNPGPSASDTSTLTTRLPEPPNKRLAVRKKVRVWMFRLMDAGCTDRYEEVGSWQQRRGCALQ